MTAIDISISLYGQTFNSAFSAWHIGHCVTGGSVGICIGHSFQTSFAYKNKISFSISYGDLSLYSLLLFTILGKFTWTGFELFSIHPARTSAAIHHIAYTNRSP